MCFGNILVIIRSKKLKLYKLNIINLNKMYMLLKKNNFYLKKIIRFLRLFFKFRMFLFFFIIGYFIIRFC